MGFFVYLVFVRALEMFTVGFGFVPWAFEHDVIIFAT